MRSLVLVLALISVTACAQDGAPASPASSSLGLAAAGRAANGCLPDGNGLLQAELRGALIADVAWRDAQMQCDGGPRPDGKVLRVTVAGPLEASPPRVARQIRFIFGIGLTDTAAGAAQALPTNVTVIVEGENLLFATLGNDKCAVEDLRRERLSAQLEKVSGRGYCIGPATDLTGELRLLVPTFTFTAAVPIEAAASGDDP